MELILPKNSTLFDLIAFVRCHEPAHLQNYFFETIFRSFKGVVPVAVCYAWVLILRHLRFARMSSSMARVDTEQRESSLPSNLKKWMPQIFQSQVLNHCTTTS